MEAGDIESAIQLFEESATAGPHFKTLELLGECLMKLGRHRQAIIPLAAAVGLGTKAFRAMFLLAKALDETGSRRDAIEKLEEAVAVKPDYKAARDLLEQLRATDR